jgi:hypothetical protein
VLPAGRRARDGGGAVKPRTFVFVGECRSETAKRRGWSWQDGRLAAKPLFEALEALEIDPAAQQFVNLFTDPPGKPRVNYRTVLQLLGSDRIIVAMGKRVSHELARRGIVHTQIVHPAARGRIRKRERYIAHVVERLGK